MPRFDYRSLSALLAGASLTFAPLMVAHADAAMDNAAASDSEAQNGILEEVVVTARRKSELLEDVPVTVTAVTTTELQKLNLQDLKNLSGVVPSLQIVQNNNRSLDTDSFRGVSFQAQTGSQNTLGFYINDTFVTNNFVTTPNFDIGQIELLSGPQGTLRGEPSPSGSLTITTHRPDLNQFGGYATLTGTQYDNTNENGAINLPVIPGKLAFRFAGLAEDNDVDGVRSLTDSADEYMHTYAGRASVRFEPIDAIEANVMYQHLYWHLSQYQQVAGPGAAGGVNPNAPANYNGPAISPGQLLAVQSYPDNQWNKEDLVTGQIDGHFLGQLISYDGSYWKWELNGGSQPLSANQLPGITADNPIPRQAFQFTLPSTAQRTQTNELRIASETPIFGFMDYTAGGFFRRTSNQVDVVQTAALLPGGDGTPTAAANPDIFNSRYLLQLTIDSPTEEKEYSEYLHFTFHLPDDTELTAGGRHINYMKDGHILGSLLPGAFAGAAVPAAFCPHGQFGVTYPGVCDFPVAAGVALPYSVTNIHDHPWIYNLSLSHKFMPTLLSYVTAGSSWRPGGANVGIFNAANDPALAGLLQTKSEKSTDIELGAKWTFMDNRGLLNVAVYHQKFNGFIYQGLPSLYLDDNGSGTPTVSPFNFTNNPDAILNGVDLETGFRFTRQWNANLNASFAHGHLTGSDIPCSPPSGGTTPAAFPAGTHVFFCPSHASTSVTPNFQVTGQSEYDQPIPGASNIDGFIRGLYTFYGRNPNASNFYVTPSYGLLSLYAGLRSSDGAWEASLFAKNALNKQVLLTSTIGQPAINELNLAATFGGSGYYDVTVTPRQEFGLTVTYSVGSR